MLGLETLISGAVGILGRLGAEWFKMSDRKNERSHELSMQDKALEFEKVRGAGRMEEIRASGQAATDLAHYEVMKVALEGQARPTGIPWVDALSTLVRPSVTLFLLAGYAFHKACIFGIAVSQGGDWAAVGAALWGQEDWNILAMVLGFWFVGRPSERAGGR